MRASRFHLSTTREIPAGAELASHRLMLRAGMIRQMASGLYSWMPLGLRVLRRVERIVREEMDAAGALELLLPMVQPAELWEESGRWDRFGPELLRLTDRHERRFCLGPTHEEIITDIFRREIRSHKQLPVTFYQIQTKFRDEVRPRFGVMRAREFLMKDAYSFHLDDASLQATYERMYAAYSRIFERIGLNYRAVQADTGSMGGSQSHEFHVLADSGEDAIAFSTVSDYAANVELAPAMAPAAAEPGETSEHPAAVRRSGAIAGAVGRHERVEVQLVAGREAPWVALVLRGDHDLNEIKAQKLPMLADPLRFAPAATLAGLEGVNAGALDLTCWQGPILADHAAAALTGFAAPAGEGEFHDGLVWGRDVPAPEAVDLRQVVPGDPSPDGAGTLEIARGIEVGHIFQLGRKYSETMNARVADDQGREQAVTMGCYGIGVSRIVAAAIEQHHDERGICWPAAIAPFDLALLPMHYARSERVRAAAQTLYEALTTAGLAVLLDDRGLRPGVMFAEMELIGVPHRLVLSERGLDAGEIEYQGRRDAEATLIPLADAPGWLQRRLRPDG
ncbi:MAG: proline--tRNA ligase [Pseudomonadota bacterium]|nr:proline--tRNA ligase [Pseudomonadota bacterium]